jgi:hypothetical protein
MSLWLRSRVPGSRRTSFVADPDRRRILHEDGNDTHRLRVEHDRTRLYVELSGEARHGGTTVPGDPPVRRDLPAQSTLARQEAASN